MTGSKQCVYLIDASIYIFRAYYSVPDTLTNNEGQLINALHGFAGFLAEFLEHEKPRHIAVAFDESLTTSFRNEIYPDYKANRESPPEELRLQFGFCRKLVQSLGLPDFSSECYEADDLIGTLAQRMREQGFSVVILSADKDLAQLLEEGDMLWDYARHRKHHYEGVSDWLGVRAGQVADWLALAGDSVDNIPGVPGIGAKTAAALLAEFGSLDILVNNAGIASLSGGILQETAQDWDNVIETQLNSVFLLSKIVGQGMAKRKSGKIINIGSMYSIFGSELVPSYSAAKGAIIQLSKSMAIELAPHNIQVNTIIPGWIETEMTAAIRQSPMSDEIVARTPAGRWGTADEFAGAAVFLSSSAADFITGESLRVDGGYAIK